eukprot:1472500-Pyramimonas_sp.AAC.1
MGTCWRRLAQYFHQEVGTAERASRPCSARASSWGRALSVIVGTGSSRRSSSCSRSCLSSARCSSGRLPGGAGQVQSPGWTRRVKTTCGTWNILSRVS